MSEAGNIAINVSCSVLKLCSGISSPAEQLDIMVFFYTYTSFSCITILNCRDF